MNLTHDQLLADLHAQLRGLEATADDLDREVAAALGIAVADYHGFLAVRAALEARRQRLIASTRPAEPRRERSLVERLAWQVETIGGLAALLYQLAVRAGDREGVSLAARILATLPVLRHTVATVETSLRTVQQRRVRRG